MLSSTFETHLWREPQRPPFIAHSSQFTSNDISPRLPQSHKCHRAGRLNWNTLDHSMESALLFLMHLPTIDHVELAMINNFPLSGLTPCSNLHWLDISHTDFMVPYEVNSHTESIHLEAPRIHRFSTSESTLATNELVHAKRRDGRPAFNLRDLKQLSVPSTYFEDVQIARYLLQNAEHLEELRMESDESLAGICDMIFPCAHTLRCLNLSVHLGHTDPIPPAGLCEELEAMAGHNVLEALNVQVIVEGCETEDTIGFTIQKLEKVLLKLGWSTLKRVSFEILIECCLVPEATSAPLSDVLQSLPEKYLSHLSNLEAITFNYSAYVVKSGILTVIINMDVDSG